MIIVTDTAGELIHASRDWRKPTGQDVADALGLGFFDRVHPDDRAIIRSVRDEARTTASEYTCAIG